MRIRECTKLSEQCAWHIQTLGVPLAEDKLAEDKLEVPYTTALAISGCASRLRDWQQLGTVIRVHVTGCE